MRDGRAEEKGGRARRLTVKGAERGEAERRQGGKRPTRVVY